MNQDKERLTINLSKKVVEILETISKKSLMSKEEVITFAILNFGKGIDDNNKNKKWSNLYINYFTINYNLFYICV